MKKIFLIFTGLFAGCFFAHAQYYTDTIKFYKGCNLQQNDNMTYYFNSSFTGSLLATLSADGNNNISSIYIAGGGVTITLYDDASASSANVNNFRDYNQTELCLSGDFDNVASSIRFTRNALGVSNVAAVYSNIDYEGSRYDLPIGMYTTADLNTLGIPLNGISSLTVRPGYYVKLKEDATHGWSRTYKKSRANLDVDYFDNATTAIEIGTVGPNGTLIQPISGSVNVAGKLGNDEINIYPNPARDYITVGNLKGSNHITIFNVMGQQALKATSTDTKVGIDVGTLAKGYYQVEIIETTSNSKSVSKFVKN